jgi:hypothetical protein
MPSGVPCETTPNSLLGRPTCSLHIPTDLVFYQISCAIVFGGKIFSRQMFCVVRGLGHPPPYKKVGDFPENRVLSEIDGPWPGHPVGWHWACESLERRVLTLRTGLAHRLLGA